MNNGAFGENFPYSNFHDLNMDWIIKIAKDFLDQYTHIQDTIAQGLEDLEEKANTLEALLQQWYDTHSKDIANQLANALNDLNNWYAEHEGYLDQYVADSIASFNQKADQKAQETIASIPGDYTVLTNTVNDLQDAFNESESVIYPAVFEDINYTVGKYIASDGTIQDDISYSVTNKIKVNAGYAYSVDSGIRVNDRTIIVAFDASDNVLTWWVGSNPNNITVPANTDYIRFGYHRGYNATVSIGGVVMWQPNGTTFAENDRIHINNNTRNIDALYPVNPNPGEMTNGKMISYDGTLANATNASASDFISVIPGNTINISNVLLTGNRSICGYDANMRFTACIYTNSNLTEVTFDVPSNVTYIRVTSPVNTTPVILYTEIIKDLQDVLKVNKWNLIENAGYADQTVMDADGSFITGNNFFSLFSIPVESNTEYITYSSSSAGLNHARRLRYLNEAFAQIGEVVEYPGTFITPQNTKYIDLSFVYVDASTLDKGVYYLALKSTNFENILDLHGAKIEKENIIGLPESIDNYNYTGARRPLIAFILDGDYNKNADMEAVFSRHSVKIGFAVPYNTDFSMNSLNQYLNWQEKGHEILTHGAYPLKDNGTYTDEQSINFIKESYSIMKGYGFDVTEYVAHSGYCAPKFIPTIQGLYDVAYTTDNHSGSYEGGTFDELSNAVIKFRTDNPYYLWRYSMQTSTLSQMKNAVDNAIQQNGLVIFYGHANSSVLQNFTEENVDELLTYIEGKGNNIKIKRPFDAVSDFYSIRYDDIIT